MLNKLILALLVVLLASSVTGAVELQRGKIKIVLNEKTGRFVVYYSEDIASPVPISLFSADDPTTSKIKLQLADKVSTLGDDGTFVPVFEALPAGGRIVWTGKTLKITQSFEFLTSAASSVVDGVKETLSLTNISEGATIRPAVRIVFDSNLGEKKEHFKSQTGDVISSETKWESSFPDWWLSPSSLDEKIGLLVMTGKGATVPSRVVFANWKRLDDASWDFAFRQGRDFNLLPYSFNDSAVAQFYDAQDLAPGANRDIVVIFGNRSAITFAGAKVGTANVLSDLLQESRNKEGAGSAAVAQDLQALENIIGQINAKIGEPTKATEEDLKLFKAILDQMDTRKAALTNTTSTKP
jgi:hypothetical protein